MVKITKETAKILGISEPEMIILKTLQEGCSILKLSIKTKIPRTSLYYMLEKLKKRRFVFKKKINKKEIWFGTKNTDLASSYREIIEKIAPSPKVKTIPEIILYSGADELMNIFWEMADLPPKSRAYGIQPKTSLMEAVKKININEAIKFNEKIKKKRLIIDGIIHEKGTEEMTTNITKENRKKFLKSFFGRSADTAKLSEDILRHTKAEIYYFENSVAIMNWHEEFAVVIKNKDVFELLIEMFKSTKYMLQKYDQNEKIARKLVDLK